MPKRTVYKMEQERIVEESLKGKSLTLQGIADDTGMNYYTVRRIVEELVARRRVQLDGTKDKARLYTYNGDRVEEHEYIPRVHTPKANRKATYILGAADQPFNSNVVDAVVNLPLHIAELLLLAHYASLGHNVTEQLNAKHKQMMEDQSLIATWADVYMQICEDSTWWYPNSLAQLTHDRDFKLGDYEKIQKKYQDLIELRRKAEYE